jgi:RNA polymerase sigma-70 factor (ECF subfamily)
MLTDDAVLISDGGAKARAARHPIIGASRMARFLTGLARRLTDEYAAHPVSVNGHFAVYLTVGGRPDSLFVPTWIPAEPGGERAIGAADLVASDGAAAGAAGGFASTGSTSYATPTNWPDSPQDGTPPTILEP